MDRVEGKKRSDKGAAPQSACHAQEREEKDESVRQVNQQTGEMMGAGMKTEKLAVQHVRQPGQGVPVADLVETKRPEEVLDGQAFLNVWIRGDVEIVVEIYEFMALHLPIGKERQKEEA